MNKTFALLIALLTLCTVAISANYNVTLYGANATTWGGIATSSPSPQILGTGSWKNNQAVSKMEFYLPLADLGTFTIDDIASLQFSTQKASPLPATPDLDFFMAIYTNGTKYGWYEERLISEPMYYNGYVSLYDAWTTYQTSASPNQMTFFDSHYGSQGWYGAPTLANLQAGNINWAVWGGAATTNIDYGAQTIKYISMSTGSAWNSSMLSYLDNIIITLTNGKVLTIDLENTLPNPVTTIQSPTYVTCDTYDVPVTVKNFTNVGAISLVMNYNHLLFAYQGVTLNSAIAINAVPDGTTIPGKFKLGDISDITTLPDDAVLFTLHLKLLPAISLGITNFTWSTTSGDCEYAGPDGSPVYVSSFVNKAWTVPARPVKNTVTGLEYCKIQDALNDPLTVDGNTITVAAGTYPEQVTISKSIHLIGSAGAIIQAPSTLPAAADPLSSIVIIKGSGISAEITGFKIQGPGSAGCGSIGRGIFVRDGAFANIHDNQILDIRDNPFSGCQNGIAIQIGRNAWSTTGTATITNNIISGYQKGAIVVDNAGSFATITGNTITGIGTTSITAQNGIQISRSATATISGNTISGNSFHLDGSTWDWGAAGILLYQSGAVSLTGGNNISGNDQNYYAYGGITGALALGAEFFGTSTAPVTKGYQIVLDENLNIDATTCTFEGVSPSIATLTQLFTIEDRIWHSVDDQAKTGFVKVKAGNVYVTRTETGAHIQFGIDAANNSGVVHVQAGDYGTETAANRMVFGVNGPHQFGLFIDKENLTVRGYKAGGVPVATASEAAVLFKTGSTADFGPSGIFVQANGVTLEGLKVGDNYNGAVISSNKTVEVVGDAFTMNKCFINTSSDQGAFYMGRWDVSHPMSSYGVTNNIFNNTVVSINSGVGITGDRSGRLITGNTFTGVATPYLIGFRGWNGASPAQGWILDPVGGAVITGNAFNNTDVDKYVVARGNSGGYVNSELRWADIWNLNTYGNHVVTLANQPAFDVRSYSDGSYPETRRISPKIQENVTIGQNGDVVLVSSGTYNESVLVNTQVKIKGANAGILAKGRSGAESIIDPNSTAAHGFKIVTDYVTIDGFTVTNSSAYTSGERYGIVTIEKAGTGNFTGINVRNNIISQQFKAIDFNNTDNFEIFGNWLHGENASYNSGCIWVDDYGTSSNTGLIKNNDLDGYSSVVEIQGDLTHPVKGVTITENRSTGGQYVLFGLQASTVSGNTVQNVTTGSHVFVGGGCKDVSFTGNNFDGGTSNGFSISNNYGAGINSELKINNNSITGHNVAGKYEIYLVNAGYDGLLDATCNWFGSANYNDVFPKINGNVTFAPYLVTNDLVTPVCSGAVPPVYNQTTNLYYYTIQSAIDATETATGNVIVASAGTYNENVNITKAVVLKGANVGQTCYTGRTGESKITGSGGAAITVSSNGVTIDGFEIINTTGNNAVYAAGYSNLLVQYNNIHNIGTTGVIGPVHAVSIVMSSTADIDNVKVLSNCISDINNITNNGSGSGVVAGFSNAAYDITHLDISYNKISNVNSKPDLSGGKGAYGILINIGASGSAPGIADAPVIYCNTITDIDGLWAHGIGLEGETPDALVKQNNISYLKDYKTPTDAVCVMVEDNAGAASVNITDNNFTNMALGIKNNMSVLVKGEGNWWGTTGPIPPLVSGLVDWKPFLDAGSSITTEPCFTPGGNDIDCVTMSLSETHEMVTCFGGSNGSINLGVTGGVPTISYAWTTTGGSIPAGQEDDQDLTGLTAGSYTVVVTDGNLCTQSITVVITVADATPPSITTFAVTRNIEGCSTAAITLPAYSAITANSTEAEFETAPNSGDAGDACGITSVTYIDVAAGTCPIVVTRTWTLKDGMGNSSICIQTINVDDNTAPVITLPGSDLTMACFNAATVEAWNATATALDACDGAVTVTATYTTPTGNCEATVVVTFTATDACSNAATSTKSFTVDHVTPPVVPANGAKTVSCPADAVAPTLLPGIADQQQLLVATDLTSPNWTDFTSIGQSFTCGLSGWLTKLDLKVGSLAGTQNFTLQIYQGNGITGTLLYTGSHSLSAIDWQSLNIAQNLAPYLTAGQQYTFWLTSFTFNQLGLLCMHPNVYNGGVSMDGCTSGCSPSYPWKQFLDFDLVFKTYMTVVPVVTDVCGTVIPTPTPVVSDNPNPVTCEGSRTFTYTYADCSGLSTDWAYTYTINYSGGLTPPANTTETVSCPSQAVDPGPPSAILDACGRTVNAVLVAPAPTLPACNGTVVWRYRYTDCDATTTADWTKTYTVTYSGGLTAPTAGSSTVSCPSASQVAPSTANINDACGRTVSAVLVGHDPAPLCNGDVVWHYTYTACDGTTTVPWTFTYHVLYSGGLTPPLNGSSTVSGPAQAVNPGVPATLTDACGRNVVPTLVGSSTPPACEGTVVWTYRYTACDGTTTADWTFTYTITKSTISGTFSYYNTANTPLNGLTVDLKQGASVIGTGTTNSTGGYAISGICPGTYDVVISSTVTPEGGINATDAALVNSWYASSYSIEKVKFYAGDAIMSNYLHPSDATRILQHFTSSSPWSNRGNWSFWPVGEMINANPPSPPTVIAIPQIVVAGSMTQNFYGLITGDFNSSYVPGAKSSLQSLTLNYDQVKEVEVGREYELPVNAGTTMEVGAVSLIMNFPSDKLEVLGVYFGNNVNNPVEYAVNGNEIRIGWQSLDPVSLKVDEQLLTLKVRAIGSLDEIIRFSLKADPLNELADGSYNTINGAILKMAEMGTKALGTGEILTASRLSLANYPNPFIGTTSFAYTLPYDGKVTLEINNVLGSKVKILVDEVQTAGDHTLTVNANELKPGVYTATLRLITSDAMLNRTIKIVRNQ